MNDGKSVNYNQKWFDYTGLTPEQTYIDNGTSAVHKDDIERVMAAAKLSWKNKSTLEVEYRIRRNDGIYRWFLCRVERILDPVTSDMIGFGSVTDIDEQKKIHFELEKEKETREQFVSMLSHDLRNPLTAAKISAQAILRSAFPERDFIKFIGRIEKNLERADSMIQNLLDANRIKAGQPLKLDIEKTDLSELVKETLFDLSTIYGDRFVFQKNQNEIHGYWSSISLRRILENLCTNAVKFGYAYTPIKIDVDVKSDEVMIRVQNQGHPIPESEKDKLFEIYQRRVIDLKTPGGWGLGLTLVKGIAHAHGGVVDVSSNSKDGTTFTVTLPLDARASAF